MKQKGINEPTFILKEPKSDTPTLIYLIHRHFDTKLKYSTGEKIHPSLWDAKKFCPNFDKQGISKSEREELKAINIQLNRYKEKFAMIKNTIVTSEIEFNYDFIKEQLDSEFKTNFTKVSKSTFREFATEFATNSEHKKETIKTYFNTISVLQRFETKNKYKLSFQSIDLVFYSQFVKYLQQLEFTKNTIGKHVGNIKMFMQVALMRGLHTNDAFKHFEVQQEEIENVYLTENELERLANIDLSKNERLNNVRDLFLIGCRTGLRFSDLSQLSTKHFVDDFKKIAIKTQKTGQTVYIPVHPQTRLIFEKYNYQLPRMLSNQKFNEYVKEVCAIAEINESVNIGKTKGGQLVEILKPKFEFVTAHTARRTFATLMYKAGFPSIAIMKITGHKTERAFLKYIKITGEENATMMLEHEYFSPLKRVV